MIIKTINGLELHEMNKSETEYIYIHDSQDHKGIQMLMVGAIRFDVQKLISYKGSNLKGWDLPKKIIVLGVNPIIYSNEITLLIDHIQRETREIEEVYFYYNQRGE